jgi:mannose/fructose/N-acetylgalactosamine-specific phosphotransferase system component IID
MKNKTQTFWFRMFGFVVLTFALPVASIAWKFGLFTEREAGYKFTGWGILAVLFISMGLFSLIKRYTKDLPHSTLKQFLDTILYVVIPLGFATTILYLIKDTFEEVYFVVRVMLIFMPIGALINPLPAWAQKVKDDHQRDIYHNP